MHQPRAIATPRAGRSRAVWPPAAIPRGLALISILLLCLGFFTPAGAAVLTEITDDTPTPPLQLPDMKDRTHTLAEYRGKVVLVNFWASWCPPCVYEMPGLVRLQERLADRPLAILAVNVGEKKYKVWKFLKLIDFELPVLLDVSSTAFDAWGVLTMPTTFLVDAKGRIRYRVSGDPGWDTPDTMAVVEKLLAEAEQGTPVRAMDANP